MPRRARRSRAMLAPAPGDAVRVRARQPRARRARGSVARRRGRGRRPVRPSRPTASSLDGVGGVDEAALTGESRPVAEGARRATIAGGTCSVDGLFRVRVTRAGGGQRRGADRRPGRGGRAASVPPRSALADRVGGASRTGRGRDRARRSGRGGRARGGVERGRPRRARGAGRRLPVRARPGDARGGVDRPRPRPRARRDRAQRRRCSSAPADDRVASCSTRPAR